MSLPLNALTPWETATNVTESARPGLLPTTTTGALTAFSALAITLLLWPLYGAYAIPMGLVFGRLLALDLTTYTLPNIYTIPLLCIGLVHALGAEQLTQATIAIMLIVIVSSVLTRANLRAARKVGMGGGDFKLLAALFAFLPLTAAFWAIAAGCVLYAPIAFAKPKSMVPFGVPMVMGWVVLLRWPHLPNWLFSTIS